MSNSGDCPASIAAVRSSTLQYAWDYFKAKIFRRSYSKSNEVSAVGKTVIVTGANRGLGKAVARALAQRSANVIMGCRDLDTAEGAKEEIYHQTGNENLDVRQVDLSDYDSVRNFCRIISATYPEIDLLIHVAGMIPGEDPGATTKLGDNLIMTVNYFSPVLMTTLLMDNLKRAPASRIVFVGDGLMQCGALDVNNLEMSDVKNWGFLNCFSYCNSKLALAYYSKELATRLKAQNAVVSTHWLCPGLVLTDAAPPEWCFNTFFNRIFSLYFSYTPEQAAETVLLCALGIHTKDQSGYCYRNLSLSPLLDQSVQDLALSEALWVKTRKILALGDENK